MNICLLYDRINIALIFIFTTLRNYVPSHHDFNVLWGQIALIMMKCTQSGIICTNIAPRFIMTSGFLIRQRANFVQCPVWDGVERCKDSPTRVSSRIRLTTIFARAFPRNTFNCHLNGAVSIGLNIRKRTFGRVRPAKIQIRLRVRAV